MEWRASGGRVSQIRLSALKQSTAHPPPTSPPPPMASSAAAGGDAEEQLLAQLQVRAAPPSPPSSPVTTRPRLLYIVPADLAPQDVPTEQLMQIRKQIAEEAQYFNESFQQLRMAQS